MVPEKLIDEFVERLRAAAGKNLRSVILYGSAAAGDYVADYSDVNLLCVLGDTSFAAIEALAPAIAWWGKQKHRAAAADECGRDAAVGGRFLHRISGHAAALSRALGRRRSEDAGDPDAFPSGAGGV